ncbi:MAG TPA: arginine--tRNA ligase [Candidatus Limnocylindrales bacterium]|nr:arginine--tRNA ligase [Candidatus Limnocylindrales bacterium]
MATTSDDATTAADASIPPSTVRARVREAVAGAWAAATAAGALPAVPDEQPAPAIEIERPANPEHGDFATNLAMKLARPLRRPPLAIAEAIVDGLSAAAGAAGSPIASAVVAPPGFINLRLADTPLEETIDAILDSPASWGRVAPVRPRSVNVEFVSANPTGPLTIGNARGAFIGDLLSRILEAGGQRVTREYYFNDAGGQIDKLGASVLALRRGDEVPEDGYRGAYVADLAATVPDDVWAEANAEGADGAAVLGHWAAGRVRAGIEASLERLGCHFDVWKSEGSLHAEGWVERAVERLRAGGHLYEQDGALWFRSTAFGDDKDRVVIRSNGAPTYFAADLGYVTEKFSRGFDHLIYIWGVDHHGTVARLRNAAGAMGYDREAVQILLYAWVHFVRPWAPDDGERPATDDLPVRTDADEEIRLVDGRKMVVVSNSKRTGKFVTLDDLLEEVGVDATRWYFASRGATTQIDFDIERMRGLLAALRRGDYDEARQFPVYYVQYAHARAASIERNAADAGIARATSVAGGLSGGPEAALARAIVQFPEVVEDAIWAEETLGVTTYVYDLASRFSAFYRDAKVIDPDEPERSARRLALVAATRTTLANALGLLGISAPDQM